MIEICAVGGYDHVGRNMTAVRVDDEVIILDMGVLLDKYIEFTQDEDKLSSLDVNELMMAGAIPNINHIKDWMKDVLAIVPSHGHLDHVGAVPFLSNKFDAPIVCTPLTAEVVRTLAKDAGIKLRNKVISVNINATYKVSKKISIEFVNMTHSIPHTALVVVKTPYGKIIYSNDFKLDQSPTLGQKVDLDYLREIGDGKDVLALLIDSTYAHEAKKTPSEAVAKELLRDVMLSVDCEGKLMVVSTFSSHIARLKSIIEFGKQLKRKIVFLGRSLAKYTLAAEAVGLVHFTKDVEMTRFSAQAKKKLRDIEKDGREKYLLVVTGHQGEPGSMLEKMTLKKLPFEFKKEDIVIFSCTVIPTSGNKVNRAKLEDELRLYGVRMFKDVHVSGHGAREDQRDLIKLLRPKYLIPSHCFHMTRKAMTELGLEMGYDKEMIPGLSEGDRVVLK